MIVPLNPPLEGVTAERFQALAQTLIRANRRNPDDLQMILNEELHWLHAQIIDGDQFLAFEASVRVLLDLVRLGWDIREQGYGIELISEPPKLQGLTTEEVLAEKQQTRCFFEPTVQNQLGNPSVRDFVKRMEEPSVKSGKKPITLLIAEGAEIHARLMRAPQVDKLNEDRLANAILPYLQLANPESIDEYTGHSLRDIWRYFRYSWSIPQFSTPGRQLLYLIRDAAHPCHPVMGIIGLNNCALQMGEEREYYLGWNLRVLKERLNNAAVESSECLAEEYAWLERQIGAALDDVEISQLLEQEELENPSRETIAKLRRRAKEFDRLRDETLRELEKLRSDNEGPVSLAETESEFAHPPVDEDMLRLEGKSTVDPTMQKARRHLVARKRSALLAELLHSRLMFKEYRDDFLDPKKLGDLLQREEFGIALQTVLAALKSRYAGINMLEISTCGAIPPYNHLLGGKLAALLLFSPEIVDDYRRLYARPSIISSQMKNAHVCRDNTLVYLGTTSLYAHGSSQYERVKLPSGIISPEQIELRYKKVGLSAGYGTLQFLDETRASVERFLTQQFKFRDINSIFGEGPSPKLRQLVAGLKELGFPPDTLMVHNRQRLIYAVELTSQAKEFLNARNVILPDYLLRPEEFRNATEKISAFWRKRWLESRLRHIPSTNSLLTTSPWKLSDRIRTALIIQNSSFSVDRLNLIGVAAMKKQQDNYPGFEFWKAIASSGPKVTSESLTEADFSRIHVETPFEDFIMAKVKEGASIFLTGNAGDGKTHVLRRLAPVLKECGVIVVEDATAVMRKDQIGPVLDRWREAIVARVPFCIAINEYPLYLLRSASRSIVPVQAQELDHQCRNRLIYGVELPDIENKEKLLVIDLSLRNPLHPEFVKRMLERLLSDSELDQTPPEFAPMLARNLARLRDDQVQDRLLELFGRLSDMGVRTTIRELWIVLSRMVLGYRQDLKTSLSDGTKHWYSEVLFANDTRFTFSKNLARIDPSSFSHPVWDVFIEDGDNEVAGWKFGLPRPKITDRPDRLTFQALKRAFYFEHQEGKACFELEEADAAEFRKILHQHRDDDPVTKRQMIEAINRAYCAVEFPGSGDSLYLWNGHRFHEQPSRVFLAYRHIPEVEFQLLKPRIPRQISQSLPEYRSNHLVLRYVGQSRGSISLRIDFPLYMTMQKLRRGLPRKLLQERDLFRLDAFIEALHSVQGIVERRILSANLERRELLEIEISPDGKRYERISK